MFVQFLNQHAKTLLKSERVPLHLSGGLLDRVP
jgi:hypothetical protein